jgi:hypothetical protein
MMFGWNLPKTIKGNLAPFLSTPRSKNHAELFFGQKVWLFHLLSGRWRSVGVSGELFPSWHQRYRLQGVSYVNYSEAS